MHPKIADLVRRHALGPTVSAELDALWSSRDDGAQTLDLDSFDPVCLDGDSSAEAPVAGRYEDLGALGEGSMGEVRRVRDLALNRVLAMKVIHPRHLGRATPVARFLEEAQATAQLQHPNIVPVHDIGQLPDGRVWFTMREIRGRTLREVIREVHEASGERWEAGASGWSFRRAMAAFYTVCQAVAYAHERGVVHRDLKPDNVMVGAHAEVYVLDWGLARILGRPEHPLDDGDEVLPARASRTRAGQVVGTPVYMAPEQALGLVDEVDARSDVYALGAILYHLLGGRPPYRGRASVVLQAVRTEAPPPLGASPGPPIPVELVAACERAMARERADRFPTASALAAEVQAWLDGSRRRAHAREVTERALAGVAEAAALRERAAALREEAAALLEGVASFEPEARKAPGWAREDEAEAAEQGARLKELEVDRGLYGALRIAPDLPEAHEALAARHRARHELAESARDRRALVEAETLLREHAAALPRAHPLRAETAAYLQGDGALTLLTDPPGAEVRLFRYEERNRRLVEVFERSLGPSPLRAVPLPMGSYLCLLEHPERAPVRYPVEVTRRGHWDGVPPGASEPEPVWLPPKGWLGPDEVYIPAGRFRAGGDPEVNSFPAMRLWCDALVMHRFPVTNRQYLAFLDDLVAQGREEEALRHVPRERAGTKGALGAMIYGYEGGRFGLRPDAEGDMWHPDWPVVMVDWHGSRAYLAWLEERTGRPWRLPREVEWERAARGVDGRLYPWGDHSDPGWCCMSGSQQGVALPVPVEAFTTDCSPWGVRGLGGNVRE